MSCQVYIHVWMKPSTPSCSGPHSRTVPLLRTMSRAQGTDQASKFPRLQDGTRPNHGGPILQPAGPKGFKGLITVRSADKLVGWYFYFHSQSMQKISHIKIGLNVHECCWTWWLSCVFLILYIYWNLQKYCSADFFFWWLASNLELTYPSKVYSNLPLMIGRPVVGGGLHELPTSPIIWRSSGNLWNMLWPSEQPESTNIILTWNERD